ncbi:MAG: NUDIX domain-containing protein [Clostridia bacterium]|nr:NUDIX domain-containing protein [Clostridia bacterium]
MREYSAGAALYVRDDQGLRYYVVQEKSGHHGLPKGHIEAGETRLQTARREILEETGLEPEFLEGFCRVVTYPLSEKPGSDKEVTFFLARAQGRAQITRPEEILDLQLLPLERALEIIEYDVTREVLKEAHAYLLSHPD